MDAWFGKPHFHLVQDYWRFQKWLTQKTAQARVGAHGDFESMPDHSQSLHIIWQRIPR